MLRTYLTLLAKLLPSSKERPLKIAIKRGSANYLIDPDQFDHFTFMSGDVISVKPWRQLAKLAQTPDRHFHIKIDEKKSIRIPPAMILTEHTGYLVPEHLCVLTGVGTHSLDPIGKKHIENYIKYMGLYPEMTFLEIGCGIGRDAFQLLPIIENSGKYIGIDVTRDSILWLQKNITTKHYNFSFFHFDAKHELYNPLGSKNSVDFSLPTADKSVDRIALGSVFTHLFEEEIVHYMKEIKRVLKDDGLAYATFFLYEEKAITASRTKSSTPFNLKFEHPFADGCFVNDPVYKTGAIAYTNEAILRMIEKGGLKLSQQLVRGSWSGLFPESDDGQDVAILGVS